MRLCLPLFLSAFLSLSAATTLVSAQSGTVAALSVEYQRCEEDGTVSVSFLWKPVGALWLDVSESSTFSGWANSALNPGQSKYLWTGLRTSTTYYARASSPTEQGWVASNTLAFATPVCNLSISPNGAKNLVASSEFCSNGLARVTLTWKRYTSGGWHDQWLDVSTDPNFTGWANSRLGPGLIAWSGVPFEPDTTYYIRVNTYGSDGVWWPSGVVTFHTLECH
jgi:hypothetical protein